MAFEFYGTAGGLVDETCWQDGTGATFFIGAFVYNLGQAPYPNNYSFLTSLNNPSGSNGTCEGFQLVADNNGPIIRMISCDVSGQVELDTDIHTSTLSSKQLAGCHICVGSSKAKRQLWIDGVLIATDTRVQTGTQYFTTFMLGYGGKPPVSLALAQLLSGYPTQADVTNMASGMDVRDIAAKSGFRLSATRQFLARNDLYEDTGLDNGFVLNNGEIPQRQLELDIPPQSGTVTWDSNLPAMATWSGVGAVAQPQSVLRP